MNNESQIVLYQPDDSTCSILEHMGNDGKQHYTTAYYNLDAILSVGYRVNSVNATSFRRWSNTILKQHLLQGYSINRHLVAHLFSRLLMDKGIIMRSVINLSSVRTVR